jgi:glycosyltransferase involved in cell wall biosynthesis
MRDRVVRWGGDAVLIPAGSFSEAEILRDRDFWTVESGRCMRVLAVGRLESVKGLEDLIRAIGLVRRQGQDIGLELVGSGDGPYEGRLRDLVAELGLAGSVTFTGPLPHGPLLFQRYREADLLVMASLSEGTPKVVGEAFAHGLPVVATDVGNLPELVSNGRGLLTQPGRPNELARAISAYYRQPERLRVDGIRCLAHARALAIEATSERLAAAVSCARAPTWVLARRRR